MEVVVAVQARAESDGKIIAKIWNLKNLKNLKNRKIEKLTCVGASRQQKRPDNTTEH